MEKEKVDFSSSNEELYHIDFSVHELSDAIKKSHDTTTGLVEIHYLLLKNLPHGAIRYL